FDLAPITILTGANSSGKSSVIKALKLLQNYWLNLKEEGILDFSEGTHDLGDFENVLPFGSDKKVFTVSYKLKKHILFGDLYIENVFKMDDSPVIKNGKLKRTSLYHQNNGKTTMLYEVKYKIDPKQNNVETNIKEYYINKDTIINSFIPKLKELAKQRELFYEKCPKPQKSNRKNVIENKIYKETFGDYTGNARCIIVENYLNDEDESKETSIFFEPIVDKDLCSYIGVDFEIWKDIEKHEGVSFLRGYPKKLERLFQDAKQFIQKEDIVTNKYSSRTLDLIAKIPITKYDSFEEELWEFLCKEYPQVADQTTKDSFQSTLLIVNESVNQAILEYVEPFEIYEEIKNSFNWKKLVQKYSKSNFLSWFNKLEEEDIKDISNPTKYTNKIVDLSFQDKKAPSLNSIIFHSILFYSKSLDSRIFNTSNVNVFDWNIERKIPLMMEIQEEIERISYTLIQVVSNNMFFIDAIRANVRRFYTFSSQGTSFNNVLLKYLKQSHTIMENKFMDKWIKEFDIGDSVEINRVSSIGAEILIYKGKNIINLIDVGYGVTPFLALLLNILSAVNERSYLSKKDEALQNLNDSFGIVENIIVVEEPEINLHPKLQSKLADFFWDAHKTFNINFIIETHSEYLIRKLQYLTAKGEIETDDAILHYISIPQVSNESQVKTIYIKSNGQLSEPFGAGFTDESSRWIKEMFILPNQE
ncbi:hypothetical protein EZS27_023907, partial [termite gut metagenome]